MIDYNTATVIVSILIGAVCAWFLGFVSGQWWAERRQLGPIERREWRTLRRTLSVLESASSVIQANTQALDGANNILSEIEFECGESEAPEQTEAPKVFQKKIVIQQFDQFGDCTKSEVRDA